MEIIFVFVFAGICIFVFYLSYLSKKSEKENSVEEDEVLDRPDQISNLFETEPVVLDETVEMVDDESVNGVSIEKFKARRNKKESLDIDEEII